MMIHLIRSVICQTYEKEFRRKPGFEKTAMKITFNLYIDHSKEEGYRYLDLIIMFHGYVGVFIRERSTLVPIEALDGDDGLKPGYDYVDTVGDWQCLSCHDSCWTSDGVNRLIWEYRDKLSSFSGLGDWYSKVELTQEEYDSFVNVERERRKC